VCGVSADGTKSVDCEFDENGGALPACGYETAHDSTLNWTTRSHGQIATCRHRSTTATLLALSVCLVVPPHRTVRRAAGLLLSARRAVDIDLLFNMPHTRTPV